MGHGSVIPHLCQSWYVRNLPLRLIRTAAPSELKSQRILYGDAVQGLWARKPAPTKFECDRRSSPRNFTNKSRDSPLTTSSQGRLPPACLTGGAIQMFGPPLVRMRKLLLPLEATLRATCAVAILKSRDKILGIWNWASPLDDSFVLFVVDIF